MAYGALIGGLVSGAMSFLGGSSQADATAEAAKDQIQALRRASRELDESFSSIISDVEARPAAFAGQRVQGAPFQPTTLAGSQADAISANAGNLDDILSLVGRSNQATIQGDLARVNQLFPGYQQTMGNLSNAATSLSGGQLPFDRVQDIISDRASASGSFGVPGGAGPATLRDLGLNSLDAVNQGQSLFQSILQAADQLVSPISRQTAAPQFFASPQESTQLNLSQAQLQQQSQQNINNLNAQPDPAANLLMQLRIQQATGKASTQAQVAGISSPVVPSTMGLAAQSFAQPLGNAIGSLFGGSNNQGFDQGFGSFGGGGFNSQAYNSGAQYYNTFGPGSSAGVPPKAIVV